MALRLMKVAKEDVDPSVAAPTYWLLVGNMEYSSRGLYSDHIIRIIILLWGIREYSI